MSEQIRQFGNRLSTAKSPYLLQHAKNPVAWHPWGEEAFLRAVEEDKPIFLSIGYSTCHWCHVMERESFENPSVAEALNRHFVSIKVDREERPDVDKVYMTAVQAMGVAGGWPLSVWLTPTLDPFYGGTYFPPEGRFGRMGFIDLLKRIAKLWREDRRRILDSARDMAEQLKIIAQSATPAEKVGGPDLITRAAKIMKANFDWQHGGFGAAPKFPRPVSLRFLLRHGHRSDDNEAREMVFRTLEAMASGGIYDQLGGGFARYSVDEEWQVPHFEKMLYDNAQLLETYVEALQVLDAEGSHDPRVDERRTLFTRVIHETAEYVLRDMTSAEGAFYTAEDADSEGREGAFYVWTEAQVRSVLKKRDADFAIAVLGVTSEGNFIDHSIGSGIQPSGENVLRRAMPIETAARSCGISEADAASTWQRIRKKLLEARSARPRPHRDDKVLTSWNGLMIGAFASAGGYFGRTDWIEAARRAAAFLREKQFDERAGRLGHAWRDGPAEGPELLDDYAFVATGLIPLYEATFEKKWLEWAVRLCERIIERFADAQNGGFFMAAESARQLPVRMKEEYDGAEPSGNSAAAQALLRIGRVIEKPEFEQAAERTLAQFAVQMEQLPESVPNLLSVLDQWHTPAAHVILTGDRDSERFRSLETAARKAYWPDLMIGFAEPGSPIAAAAQAANTKKAEAHFCHDGRCENPVEEAGSLAAMLRKK